MNNNIHMRLLIAYVRYKIWQNEPAAAGKNSYDGARSGTITEAPDTEIRRRRTTASKRIKHTIRLLVQNTKRDIIYN